MVHHHYLHEKAERDFGRRDFGRFASNRSIRAVNRLAAALSEPFVAAKRWARDGHEEKSTRIPRIASLFGVTDLVVRAGAGNRRLQLSYGRMRL